MSRINVGKVAPIPKGNWSSSTAYEKLNLVNKSGILYIAKQDVPANTPVTDTTYWMKATNSLSIGTVNTVSATTGASATITDGTGGQILNLSIPRGVTGNESIDDTAGDGDDDVVWSADKTYNEITDLKSHKGSFLDLEKDWTDTNAMTHLTIVKRGSRISLSGDRVGTWRYYVLSDSQMSTDTSIENFSASVFTIPLVTGRKYRLYVNEITHGMSSNSNFLLAIKKTDGIQTTDNIFMPNSANGLQYTDFIAEGDKAAFLVYCANGLYTETIIWSLEEYINTGFEDAIAEDGDSWGD